MERLFEEYERPIRIRNYKLACVFAAVFMPGGASLDFFVYDTRTMLEFLPMRLFSGALLLGVWFGLDRLGHTRLYRYLGLSVAVIPILAISWMIARTEGASSPYYAGLNLCMLGSAILLRWTLQDSYLIFALSLVSYLVACLAHGSIAFTGVAFNNIYFLFVTGLFVVAGSWYYNGIRRSEFELRHHLDENREELERSNSKLGESLAQLEVSNSKLGESLAQLEVSNSKLGESLAQLEESNSKLGESNAKLEDFNSKLGESNAKLEESNGLLEESNRKLRELDEIKSRFFANISHELRTPLTLLIAPLESLIHRSALAATMEDKDLLGTMHGNAMRLLKLINDLLDLVRLEAGRAQVRTARLDVAEFMKGLSTAVGGVAQDKRLHLSTYVDRDLGTVMADQEKLERICLNLLFNAMKFTAAGGRVEFNAMKEEDGFMLIEVKDSGIGIAPDQLPHIFNRFWQADTSSQRKFQGMGIGLALVKELAEVQGGSVNVESAVGKGTTMSVRLPLHSASQEPVEDEPEIEALVLPEGTSQKDWIGDLYRRAEMFPAITSLQATLRPVEIGVARSRKPKLLIADDEPDMLRFLRSQLSGNFEVLEAVDGHQAVEKAAQFLPDIILSDMMMPEKDGLEVCRELRQRTSTQMIPVVLLTARADERTKLDCLAAGASDFLSKPFSMTEVQVRLKNLVDTRLYQKELFQQKQQLEAALEQIKETESLLVRNEKLASLGRMSAGLIHEINNPLNYARQGILLMADAGKHMPEKDRLDFEDTLKDVREGVNRVIQIISDLRGFTRNSNQISQTFELKTLVDTGVRFFSHEWKDNIGRDINVPAGLEVKGDSNHFTQVLVNLVQNALDAVRDKEFKEGDGPKICISARAEGDKILFVLRDNGSGIPQEIRDQIFDPFFTTKDVGQGMGLGLAICNRIISDHGGRIEVRSEPGQFTEFTLVLPSAESRNHH